MTIDQYHDELAHDQLESARAYLSLVKDGAGIQFPWPALKAMVGNIMPGWLCVIGGRAKSGKTTLLLGLADYLLQMKIPFVYVGTETEPGVLKIKLAAQRLGLSVTKAVTGELSGEDDIRLDQELVWISTRSNISIFPAGWANHQVFLEWGD